MTILILDSDQKKIVAKTESGLLLELKENICTDGLFVLIIEKDGNTKYLNIDQTKKDELTDIVWKKLSSNRNIYECSVKASEYLESLIKSGVDYELAKELTHVYFEELRYPPKEKRQELLLEVICDYFNIR